MKKVVLVYNKQSGSALPFKAIQSLLETYNYTVEIAIDITSKQFASKLKKAVSQKRLIVAIGGDGTISAVASMAAGSDAILLPLPGGTLNNFTKDAGIPQDIKEALKRTRSIKPRFIDVGCVNDTVFINNSSIGIYPQSLTIREDLKGKVGKWTAAAYAILHAFIRFKVYTVTLDKQETFQTPFIFVGNNRYHVNNFAFTTREQLNEGLLCVYAIKTTSRFTFIKLLFAAARGALLDVNELHTYVTTSITIKTHKKRVSVSHDGEISRLYSPLHYESHHKKLRILG